jgi:DNA replicative helicase MCM subunit Mcm2 (Cdc46/Mcm family)
MMDRGINLFIANYFIPKFFVQYVQEDRLKEVISIPKLIDSEGVINKNTQIKSLIQEANIIVNPANNWLWICPKCGSSEVCAYRWKVLEDGSKLIEGEDNLEIN